MTATSAASAGRRAPRQQAVPFGPLVVSYDDRVLAPRPWTLAQSEWAAELASQAGPGAILELCAGAGHIGLAAAVLAERDLVQVEAEPVAAAYALANAARAGWAERVEVRPAALETALRPDESFPLILADPPYLPTEQVARWPGDPVTAIDGGPDGLRLVRVILEVAAAHLRPGGHLLLQTAGPEQAAAVEHIVDQVAAPVCAPVYAPAGLRVTDEQRAVLRLDRR